MKTTITKITKDGIQTFEGVVGSIKKIFIKSNKPLHHVNLTFTTSEGEVMYKMKAENEIVLIYPWNFIDVQGRGVEYYSQGNILLEVDGLVNEDIIEQVTIFYE